MKATLDIPDELYRQVKAKSALEGRPMRAVAIELFQTWLCEESSNNPLERDRVLSEQEQEFPWLTISRKYVKSDTSHDMNAIRESIARGWSAEVADKVHRDPAKS